MLTFLQYLAEAEKQDYTYTTEQGKTDEHVKQFVKDYIDKPSVELEDNGVTITGQLNSKYNEYIQLTDDGIQATSDLSKQLTAIVSDLMSKMLDNKVVRIRAKDTEQDAVPQASKTNYILTTNFECSGSNFNGIVKVTVSWLGSSTDSLKSSDKCSITIEGSWTEQ